MSSTTSVNAPPPTGLVIPQVRRNPWRPWLLAGNLVVAVLAVGVWKTGLNLRNPWANQAVELATLPVDEGEMLVLVTENGSLESANNATVRCQVEALVGMTGGAPQGAGGRPGAGGNRPGMPGGGGQGGQGGGGGQGGQATSQPSQGVAKMKSRAGARANASAKKAGVSAGGGAVLKAVPGGADTAAAGAGGSGAASGGGAKGGAGGAMGGGATGNGASGATQTVATKPVIRSFSYQVAPHVPLRPKAPAPVPQPKPVVDLAAMGGGGRRGGGGQGGAQEKPGATRIISILDEGTRVKAGQVLCELDSSAFRDELQAQQIRWAQAKAWVEQARSILAVNEISLKEYGEGIYPQDRQLIRQYVATCKVEEERTRKNLAWSRKTAAKGFRAPAQVLADKLALQQADIALREAQGMAERLEKYTAPRLLKNLQAKNEAIRADKLAQESSFQLETDRRKRLETMIEHCTLRAPRGGIVVYANQPNGWGRVDNPLQQGVTVRENQPIINLPDPKHMRVRAKINESKVAMIHAGQKAEILVDAFPNRPLSGTVGEVTPIPAPNGAVSDVRVYFAMVEIDSGGFDELRPGLSARVSFQIDTPATVTRVPVQAVRWLGGLPFAAVARPAEPGRSQPSWQWRSLSLGLTDANHAEVVDGLKPGERVVADPGRLPAPRPAVAVAPVSPRG